MRNLPPDLVATDEARQILGYKDQSSVNRLVYEHKLVPAMKMPGKRGAYLFLRAEVEALRDQRAERAVS